ncbi:hypothetical protein GCM10011358_00010 [Sinisalibacter lacisalsi]|uniref:Uncharacterized protein n=1 Tax=Sinisalibacter lacisalsi TaxID=1526570 RepID=A0ABQ1Q9S7_9RHOB|nr:hypothetical protein GCM10011358_00010 [Sinisalibacter lacisalsi]
MLQIEVTPFQGQNLAASGAGQDKQADRVGGSLVFHSVEGLKYPLVFRGGQVALTWVLWIPAKTIRWILFNPAPADRQVEGLPEDLKDTICTCEPGFTDTCMEAIDMIAGQFSRKPPGRAVFLT